MYIIIKSVQYLLYFFSKIPSGFFYMILSELKLLGLYFAFFALKTDYVITEDILDEFEKKKFIIK